MIFFCLFIPYRILEKSLTLKNKPMWLGMIGLRVIIPIDMMVEALAVVSLPSEESFKKSIEFLKTIAPKVDYHLDVRVD